MFHGSMVALVTPMDKTGAVDFEALRQLVEWHIESGTRAVIVSGTTGESGTLESAEKMQIMKHVVEQAAERIDVIAGTGAVSTRHAIALTQAAMAQGVEACLLMTPAYVKPTQEGLYQHFAAIAQAAAIPQILYNVPSRTACDLLPKTIARLANISNIVGIKEATGEMARVDEILNLCGDRIDIYSGDDKTALDLIKHGGKGVISVTANIAPALMQQMTQAALAKQENEARAIDERLQPLHQALFAEANPIPSKWALAEMGKIQTGIRLPLTPLSDVYHEPLRMLMRQLEIM
ncbi:MAG: 4-hydroxy-tetrahydrodipicolinate synthase [Gammaproteobacteria bacterium]